MSLKNLLKVKESDIEKTILDYLERVPNSFVKKNHQSGKPIKKGNFIILVPWGSPYCRTGISDIEFIWNGKHFAFEVKTPEEHRYIARNLKKIILLRPDQLNQKKDKKKKHILEQYLYIKRVKESGGEGAFVSSLEEVKAILNQELKGKK